MGNKFFRIVGVASYILAALALAVAIFATIASGSAWLTGVDENISQPEISMDDYRESVSPEQEDEDSLSLDDTETVDWEARKAAIQERINHLTVQVNKYARLTSQGSADKDGLRDWLINQTNDLSHQELLAFLNSLNRNIEDDLVKPAEKEDKALLVTNVPGLEDIDSTHIKWDSYLSWFTHEYMARHQDELSRIQQERMEQAQAKAGSLATLIIAGSAFAVFVFATVILLLVRIESNTRD